MSKYCTTIYMSFMFLVFPLYYQNNYINILEAKTSMFTVATVTYFIAVLLCYWYESVAAYEKEQKTRRKHVKKKAPSLDEKGRIPWTTYFLLALVIVLAISTIASGDILGAWHGTNTKLFGAKILLLCCGVYYFVSKGFVVTKWMKGCLFFGMTVVYILAILNRFLVDPLGMYDNLVEEQRAIYLSTIGNINILSSYICIFLPLSMGLFLYAENCIEKVLSAILVVLGVMAGVCTNSDSFFLGVLAALAVYFWYGMTSFSNFARYVSCCTLFSAAMSVLRLLSHVCEEEIAWENIQDFLLHEVPWLGITLILAVVWFGMCFLDYRLKPPHTVMVKIRTLLFCALGIGGLMLLVYILAINKGVIGSSSSYLVFDDEWGTNRGYLWRNTWALFGELPWYQKLFGIGPGQFDVFFEAPNTKRVIPFVDPHSDYLFYLVTFGVLGLLAWAGAVISALIASIKEKENPAVIMLIAILLASLAQGMVNTSLVFTAPYFFMALGAIQTMEWKKNNNNKK